MQPLVLMLSFLLLPLWSGSSSNYGLAMPSHALTSALFFFESGHSNLVVNRIADSIIGLSCLALAATLFSFLLNAGKDLSYRWVLLVITLCTAAAGLVSLLSAALVYGSRSHLVDKAPLVLAVLILAAACTLPYLLPELLSTSRELESSTEAARKNEDRFLAAASSTNDALMFLDALRSPDGTIEDFLFTYLNSNAEKIIDKPSSQVLGARVTRILPLDPKGKLFEEYRQVVRTGRPLIQEFPLYRNDPYGPWMRHHVAKLDDGLAITASDITERKHADYSMSQQSQHDPLTGLPNRRLLDDRLEQAMARSDRYGNKVGVFLINLDSFQQINETYGREIGDEAILATASRLRDAIRGTDGVLRFGGDEFVVILPDMMLELDVRRTAATLVAVLREPITLEGKTLHLSCSLGAAVYPTTAQTTRELITGADIAMSRAKSLGKNRYVLYNPITDSSFGSGMRANSEAAAEADQCAD